MSLPGDRPTVRFVAGPESRWVAEPLRAEFTRSSGGWSNWSGQYGPGPLAATVADGPGVVVDISTAANILGRPDGVTLSDDRGHVYPKVQASAGSDMQQVRFQGPIDPAATTVTLSVDGYWVPETREWTVEIPVR